MLLVFELDIKMLSSRTVNELILLLGVKVLGLAEVFKLEKIDLVLGRLNLILNLECRICWASE